MPRILPFRGLTPAAGRAADIASPPYDVLSAAEARAICARRPDSFLHVTRPDALLPPDADPHGAPAYDRACQEMGRLRASGAFVREATPRMYVYRLQWRDVVQTGVAALASVLEYDQGAVRRHEHTRPDKEADRADHTERVGAQCGPVFLICPASSALRGWLHANGPGAGAPLHDFTADDGVRHTVWPVAATERTAEIAQIFADMDATYVADGHHRSAAASVVRRRLIARGLDPGPDGPAAGFLSVTFPDDEVTILPYNRAVRDLHGLTPAELLARLADRFDVLGAPATPGPDRPGVFDVYLPGGWTRIALRAGDRPADPVAGLDVAVLQDRLLAPLLGIGDPRTDNRIAFVGGIRGTAELERLVDSGEHAVAVALHATPASALIAVADSGRVMPPKSTWFEPKLRSGLFVHLLDGG